MFWRPLRVCRRQGLVSARHTCCSAFELAATNPSSAPQGKRALLRCSCTSEAEVARSSVATRSDLAWAMQAFSAAFSVCGVMTVCSTAEAMQTPAGCAQPMWGSWCPEACQQHACWISCVSHTGCSSLFVLSHKADGVDVFWWLLQCNYA